MKIAATGFVSEKAGSVASANALILRSLIFRGHTIDFFSKESFVDPRPAVGKHAHFRFINVDNIFWDRLRRMFAGIPLVGQVAEIVDAMTYNRLLVSTITRSHHEFPYDLCLWMGDYARGVIPDLPTVSFAQGAPGSDVRSIKDRSATIKKVAGRFAYWWWRSLAALRLSPWGLPPFQCSDRIVVGSSVSKSILIDLYQQAESKVRPLPYPIDLKLFQPPESDGIGYEQSESKTLRVLWLGRIVPRKRLELFLEAAEKAIRSGVNIKLTIVGEVGFISGYERLINTFAYPARLERMKSVPREGVPALLYRHDVLCQPSDEEDFGSSVAEAQACGLPVIVGVTNGNADYLCERDIHLEDDRPETLATALREIAQRKIEGRLGNPAVSRALAKQTFQIDAVTTALEAILAEAAE